MLTLFLPILLAADPAPALRLVGDLPTAVEATGLTAEPADAATVLRVALADGPADRPPLIGTHRYADGVLRFEPRFPFAPGVRYRATFAGPGAPVTKDFTIPKPKADPPAVAAVYPSADT